MWITLIYPCLNYILLSQLTPIGALPLMPRGIIRSLLIGFILFFVLFLNGTLHAQLPPAPDNIKHSSVIHHRSTLEQTFSPESNCSNGIDDDNNGLTDMKDFHCYFSNQGNMVECTSTKIVWASSNWGLHWIDLETNEQKLIYTRESFTYDDITWCSNGKLYGASRAGPIYEIDPYNNESYLLGDVEGHYYSNGMTGDAQGNLFLTSFTTEGQCNVVKLNVATLKTEIIISLTDNMLRSAGDLCFMNGYLYVSCESNYLAKIDINKKTVEKKIVTNLPVTNGSYGMITLGDGYLYMSDNNTGIYRVDPSDMIAHFYKSIDHDNLTVLGFTSYPDLCNAPVCRGIVSISTDQFPPYCSNEGVLLTATGTGIKGESGYTWTLPNGTTSSGNVLTAKIKGTYYIRYHPLPDTCGAVDSIILDIAQYPQVELGKHQVVCAGSEVQLIASQVEDITSMYWDDGSSSPVRIVSKPGKYWIEVSNYCGLASDTVIITEREKIEIFIGNDTFLCANTSITLENYADARDISLYQWSDGSRNKEIVVSKPGVYTLEATTPCGVIADTIVVQPKVEDCECFLYVPNAFSPNNDSKNDVFNVQSNCVVKGTIRIFNRWGGMVYASEDLARGWNGFIGANGQPSGMYVYHICYEYVNRKGKFIKKGTVTMIH